MLERVPFEGKQIDVNNQLTSLCIKITKYIYIYIYISVIYSINLPTTIPTGCIASPRA